MGFDIKKMPFALPKAALYHHRSERGALRRLLVTKPPPGSPGEWAAGPVAERGPGKLPDTVLIELNPTVPLQRSNQDITSDDLGEVHA